MASASQRAAVLLFAVVLVACGVGSLALYEDQVGEHDWLKQHVGALSTVVSVGKRAFVGTQSAVVACLNVRTGSTVWRQVLPVGDVVEQMLLRKRRLVTVSSCGRNVRLWYAPTGELVWDTVLPVEVDGTSCTPASATLIDGADGTTLAAVATQSHVFVINVADGRVVWSWATGAACASTAVAAGAAPGAVTVACGDRLLAFDSVSVEGDAEDVDNPPVGDETAESGSVVFVSPTHGLVVATSSEAGVVVRAHRTSSVATVTTGQLGGAVESLSVAVHMDGAVLVELEDGTEVVVAVQESATAEAAVSADGSSVDTASDTSFGAFVVVLGTHKMTDPSVGTAVKGDVTYVATVDIGATGAVFSVSADASSTQTAQVCGRLLFPLPPHATTLHAIDGPEQWLPHHLYGILMVATLSQRPIRRLLMSALHVVHFVASRGLPQCPASLLAHAAPTRGMLHCTRARTHALTRTCLSRSAVSLG